MKLIATRAHAAGYPDPLAVRAGEEVRRGAADPEQPGWTWCTDSRGRGGWTPEAWLEERDGAWTCTQDYDSRELTVAAGEELEQVGQHLGWVLCRDARGERGWVPTEKVQASPYAGPPIAILYVRDQAAAAAFYRAVLGVEPTLDVPGMTELPLAGGARLGLMPEAGIARLLDGAVDPAAASGAARAELYLRVHDPAAFLARALAAGARLLSPLRARDWGETVAYCQDPDGHVLAFAGAGG
jgi:catechol 2,3-dioxygenase-like lactoylglutathione lyase family enzyme